RAAEAYWLSRFAGTIPTLDFPAYRKRPAVQTYRGRTIHRRFSAAFTSRLHRYAQEHELTLFMVLMAGVKALLYRYTNQRDLVIGTPIAGRIHSDLEHQLGLYLNTLAIRTYIEEGGHFEDLVQTEKQGLLEAYQHQNYPFDELVAQLNLKRDTSRSALFDVMVVLQNQAQLKTLGSSAELEGVRMTPYPLPRKTAQFDLSFTFLEQEVLALELEFNTDIYETSQIEALFDHFENLLNQALDKPHSPLEALDFLTVSETEQLLHVFNPKPEAFPEDLTITAVFEAEAAGRPAAAAVIFGEQRLTYRQLNERANQLAHFLRRNYRIEPDDRIGIQLDRSADLLVAILGALKSGAAYVPIDINY
ncbi:MAG: AMP-binding protein, partial [Phaeodactylibacter sp.]|nr:AMP-binding protein [Phaeodactylibacter sp.]